MNASVHHVLSFGPGSPCRFVSKCDACLPRHLGPRRESIFIDANHALEIYFPVFCSSLLPPLPRFMNHIDLLFRPSLKSSDLQISSLNDQLYIFCI